MSFVPVLPVAGYAGWKFLVRTMPAQQASLDQTAEYKREEAWFRERIGKIDTAEQLVSDRRLLKVALGAFGLDGDINNRFFIRKVLEEGTLKEGALANRLADKQYQKLSAAFGFGDFSTPRTKLSDFPERILTAYRERRFEIAVGAQSNDMRLALNARRELSELAGRTGISETARWFSILGSKPLRQVFEKALGLPTGLGTVDIDRQLEIFRSKARERLGDDAVSQFQTPANAESLIRLFLARSEADSAAAVSGRSAALQMVTQTAFLARLRQP